MKLSVEPTRQTLQACCFIFSLQCLRQKRSLPITIFDIETRQYSFPLKNPQCPAGSLLRSKISAGRDTAAKLGEGKNALFASTACNCYFQYFYYMKLAENNTIIIDGYAGLLDNLSTNNKLDLIARLTASVKTDLKNKKTSFKKAFGAFDSKKTADQIIDEIRSSRVFNKKLESFSFAAVSPPEKHFSN
jgi:hypothetical protein